MIRCFKDICDPDREKRCQNEARWHHPEIASGFLWCDEHKFPDDVLVPPSLREKESGND